jgi:phospholipase C
LGLWMEKALKRIKKESHAVLAMLTGALGAVALNLPGPISIAEAQTLSPSNISDHSIRTRTPIKHLIVVIGENRSFDNVFGTYVPADPKQSVWNLLSQGIVDKTGARGLNAAKGVATTGD